MTKKRFTSAVARAHKIPETWKFVTENGFMATEVWWC